MPRFDMPRMSGGQIDVLVLHLDCHQSVTELDLQLCYRKGWVTMLQCTSVYLIHSGRHKHYLQQPPRREVALEAQLAKRDKRHRGMLQASRTSQNMQRAAALWLAACQGRRKLAQDPHVA